MKYEKGSTAYIVESNRFIREVIVVRATSDFYIVRFTDSGGAIQVRGSRLFATKEDALASFPQDNNKIRTGHRSPHEYWH